MVFDVYKIYYNALGYIFDGKEAVILSFPRNFFVNVP